MSQEKPGGAKKPQKTRRNQEEPGTLIFLRLGGPRLLPGGPDHTIGPQRHRPVSTPDSTPAGASWWSTYGYLSLARN